MTLLEFKAWFEGFAENIATQPNPGQWERIKQKISELGTTVNVAVPSVFQPLMYSPAQTYSFCENKE